MKTISGTRMIRSTRLLRHGVAGWHGLNDSISV
jgi:hypothetical protein